jgi:hypothetical protein
VADAYGKEGARALTGVAKVPGPQRDELDKFITGRNIDMPTRTGAYYGEQLGAPQATAAQARDVC